MVRKFKILKNDVEVTLGLTMALFTIYLHFVIIREADNAILIGKQEFIL